MGGFEIVVSLREYQQEHVANVRAALIRHRRVIMTAPPGAGKTRMAKHIIDSKLSSPAKEGQTGRVLFAVHRRGLVENASQSFLESPSLDHGLIMSGMETSFSEKLQVASIDTLNSWWCDGGEFKGYTFDLIIFDECHSHCTKLQTFLKHHDEAREAEGNTESFLIGLSATPQGEGLSDTFKEIVSGPEPSWLIEQGYLKPFKYYNGTAGKLDRLVRNGQRFTSDSNIAAMEGLNGELVRDWERFAEGRATVGFFSSRANARHAKGLLQNAGIRAEYVDGETPDDKRRLFYKLLNQGDINYLANVGVVERGTDIPRVSCIQLATAVGSVVRYRQMIGRGSRPHPDVIDCCVARGTMICTDRGEIPIEEVKISDKIWDGVQFCCHDGACCNGYKEVIEWEGLAITPDHKVLTDEGWKKAETAKSSGSRGISASVDGCHVRTSDNSNPYNQRLRRKVGSRSGLLAMWKEGVEVLLQDVKEKSERLRTLYAEVRRSLSGMGMETSPTSKAKMRVSAERSLRMVWWSRDQVQIQDCLRWSVLDSGELRIAAKPIMDYRPNRQQWTLRTWKPSMGDCVDTVEESIICLESETEARLPFCDILRQPATQPKEKRYEPVGDCKQVEVEVWDIQNAGPRNRYCANGKVIANCVLDHGGNVDRHGFFDDPIEWSLERKVTEAKDASERPTLECPNCGRKYRGGRCVECDYEPTQTERKKQGLEFDGTELKEVTKRNPPKPISNEALMLQALYAAGRSGRTIRQAVAIAYRKAKDRNMKFRVPRYIEVAGNRIEMVRFNSPDQSKRVAEVYEFTRRK